MNGNSLGLPWRVDPRTIAALQLERLIASGQSLAGLVAIDYTPIDRPPRQGLYCFLNLLFQMSEGVPLHPRRRATRTMSLRFRGLEVFRVAVCGHCGLASFVTYERVILRRLGGPL